MADTTNQPVAATTPDLTPDAQVAEILRDMGIETPEATTPEEPKPADDAESEAPEPEQIDDSDLTETEEEEDDDPDEGDLPTLDEELAKNPVLAKRWQEQQKGLEKLVNRYKEQTQNHANIISWGQALENPDTALDAFRTLGKQLASFHGFNPSELGFSTETDNAGQGADWETAGFDSPGEMRAYQRARSEAMAEIERLKAMIEPIKSERETAERTRAFESRIDKIAPKVIEKLSKADAGWTVTREMVAEAVQNLPNLADRPSEAVRKWFSDERARHYSRLSSERTRVPDMTGRGQQLTGTNKPPEQMTGEEVIRSLGFNV